jgi:UDP-N-acetyl-D-mannosaminuronic acid dehydrogenase
MSIWLADERPDLSFPHQAGESADVQVAYCPERVLPGRVVQELVGNARVIGGMTNSASLMAIELYKTFVSGRLIQTNCRTAEMCKLAENSFRDLNIAFANELSLICDKLDINVWELIKLANQHPRVNILEPGIGVGGHCIAVDPWFIVAAAPDEAKLIRAAREVNEAMPGWVIEKVEIAIANLISQRPGLKKSDIRVACLGLAFKPNIDDCRESPAIKIVQDLIGLGVGLILVEPLIATGEITVDQHLYRLHDLEAAISTADIVCILVKHHQFVEKRELLQQVPLLIDPVGLTDD